MLICQPKLTIDVAPCFIIQANQCLAVWLTSRWDLLLELVQINKYKKENVERLMSPTFLQLVTSRA
jgi:hypothetical protein